jgi:hypothetical protein
LLWVTICASIVKFLCEVDRLLTVAPVVHQCNRYQVLRVAGQSEKLAVC